MNRSAEPAHATSRHLSPPESAPQSRLPHGAFNGTGAACGTVEQGGSRDIASTPIERNGAVALLRFWLPGALLLGTIAVRRWNQQGAFPTGVDGGQWLALGRGLFGDGRSTDGAYAPFVPLLVEAGQAVFGPMVALKLVSLGSLVAVTSLVYLIAQRRLSILLSVLVTATIGLASATAEPTAFGGYPQLIAFAFLLGASLCVARYLEAGQRCDLLGTALGLAGAAFSHHIYFPLAAAIVTLISLIWLTTRPAWPTARTRGFGVSLALGVGVLCFVPTLLAFRSAGYAPPLDASQFGVVEAFRYGTRESPLAWMSIVAGGVVGLVATARDRRQPLWQIAAAMIGLMLPLFLVAAEVRLLLPALTAGTLGLAYGWQWLMETVTGPIRRVAQIAPLLLLLLWPGADRAAGDYYRFYRVVDRSLIDTAATLDRQTDAGLAVVRHDRRGWPIGWWFEGLTGKRVAVGADLRWLGFPSERRQATLTASFFDKPIAAEQLAVQAARHDVRWLIFRKWEWIGWQRWVETPNPPVTVVYDDDEFMILAIRE